MRVDPTEQRVRVSHHASEDEAFSDMMADQLRHAPWLLLSVVVHALAVVIIMLIPTDVVLDDTKAVQMQKPQEDEVIEEKEEQIEKPKEEEEVEPQLQDEEIPVEETTDDTFDEDFESDVESAFDSNQWATEIGLGGGATAGKFSNRGGLGKAARGGSPTAEVVKLALDWLVAHQDDDGKWDTDDFAKHDIDGTPCDGDGNPVHDVGVTGLALLAFLSEGSTMRSGQYKGTIKKGVRWLIRQQDDETGLFGTTSSQHFIYDHAIAALAVTEAYGLSGKSKILRKYAQAGLNYLETHRNPYRVWRYHPQDNQNDTSVTGWCVLVYKSAQDFDLQVNKQALNDCATWFDQITDPITGRAGYMERGELSSRHTGDHGVRFPPQRGEALAAVALMGRCFLGQTPDSHPIMTTAANTILEKPPVWNPNDGSIDHYYWYYATYALYQMGKHHWKKWQKHLTKAVVETVRRDGNFRGSWDPIGVWGEEGGRVYSTAILALTLQAYWRYTRLVR